jgi:hypothetical protein
VDPVFDAGSIQSSTHCVTPMNVVNGPARARFGVQPDSGHWDQAIV